MRRELPSGTVTFLFTDVEGSTRLLHELGAERYAQALQEHRRVLRRAFGAHGGVEVDTQGDAFFVAFPTAPGALGAADEALAGLAGGPIRVRIGVNTGSPHLGEEGYVGVDVHRAARIAACGHGGQVLVSASTAALVDPEGLRDLGEHRLKDLTAPERIYQLSDSHFPPLKSLHQTNLPIPATPFLGREQELAEVLELLARDDVRLLTLTGPGGTGKTRLALQAAGAAADAFAGGVWWVPLAPLRDPQLVLATAAQSLGATGDLAAHIADRSLLLLLDNFEHVVEAAVELSGLLAACPNLQLLVTSRELLTVPGEHAHPVPPLEPQDGTELFVARARASLPTFAATDAVPELCARLEQLPLALELAAARVRVLSPEQLLERLASRLDLLKAGRGVDPRQQTLRATIEWSHDLLDADEQRLFARLAVFAGGCTLETAEQVCDADLDILQSLVDKSLVRVREGDRFWMLETIREFAVERLEASGQAEELRRRHSEYFLALAEEAEPSLRYRSKEWLDRLELEHDNLRAALDRFEDAGERQLALRLTGSVWWFWSLRGDLVEGRRRLARALDADDSPTAARARALNGAADLAVDEADTATARRRAEEALVLHRKLGDTWGAAYSVYLLAFAAIDDDLEAARQLFDDSVRQFRELGDDHYTLEATRRLAWMYERLGDRERSRVLHEENLRQARALGDGFVEATALGALASYAVREGRVEDAISFLRDGVAIHRDLGDLHGAVHDLHRLARVLALTGSAVLSSQVLARSEALHEETGVHLQPWLAEMDEETLAILRTQLDDARLSEAREQGRGLTVDEAVALALDALESTAEGSG